MDEDLTVRIVEASEGFEYISRETIVRLGDYLLTVDQASYFSDVLEDLAASVDSAGDQLSARRGQERAPGGDMRLIETADMIVVSTGLVSADPSWNVRENTLIAVDEILLNRRQAKRLTESLRSAVAIARPPQ